MEALLRDVRYALRGLARNPGMTLALVLCLALGIGAATAMYSVIDRVLLEPPPYEDPDRLVRVWDQLPGMDLPQVNASTPELLDLREATDLFSAVEAFFGPAPISLTGSGDPEQVQAAVITPGMFDLLGVNAAAGRGFTADHGEPGNDAFVVLSHEFWTRRFGASPDIVGSTLQLNQTAHQVLGVMPAGFPFLDTEADLFAPLAIDFEQQYDRNQRYLKVIGRLAPGLSAEQARARGDALAQRLEQTHPEVYDPDMGFGFELVPLQEELTGDVDTILWMLFAATLLVLLVACTNVANLLLARAMSRQGEMAVRSSLGASRSTMVRQLLTEATVLVLVGGAVGLLGAYALVRTIVAFDLGEVPNLEQVGLHAGALGFALGVSLLVTLLVGLYPALRTARPDAVSVLREGGRGSVGGLRNRRVQGLLVTAEIALAVILLVGCGLLIQSFRQVQQVDPGFAVDDVLTLRTVLPPGSRDDAGIVSFYRQAQEQLAALPGVEAVGAVSNLPLQSTGGTAGFEIDGRTGPDAERQGAQYRVATEGYFETLEIPVLEGRVFDGRDQYDSAPVAVIDKALADRYWPGGGAAEGRIWLGRDREGSAHRIVGVVGNVRHHGLDEDVLGHIYVPHTQNPNRGMTLVTRSGTPAEGLIQSAHRAIWSVQPDLAIANTEVLADSLEASFLSRRFTLWLLLQFGIVATLLAAVGIYGVLAYSVAQQRREIGLRMAIGADRSRVLRWMGWQGLRLVTLGILAGVAAAYLASDLMSTMLFEVGRLDPWTYVAVAVVTFVLGILAILLPVYRASRIEPVVALKME